MAMSNKARIFSGWSGISLNFSPLVSTFGFEPQHIDHGGHYESPLGGWPLSAL